MRLVEKCWCKNMNKLVERETFIHSSIKIGAESKEKIFAQGFCGSPTFFRFAYITFSSQDKSILEIIQDPEGKLL